MLGNVVLYSMVNRMLLSSANLYSIDAHLHRKSQTSSLRGSTDDIFRLNDCSFFIQKVARFEKKKLLFNFYVKKSQKGSECR